MDRKVMSSSPLIPIILSGTYRNLIQLKTLVDAGMVVMSDIFLTK